MRKSTLLNAQQATSVKNSKLDLLNTLILVGSIFLMLIAVYSIYMLLPYFQEWHIDSMQPTWRNALIILTCILLIIKLGFLSFILYNYFKYKPISSVSDALLPTCTVIIPAYNEGELVYHTLLSVAKSNYPVEKLQILAIDDGSKDDTWDWMLKAKQLLGNRIEIYQQPENKGKRHALYRGFHLGIGDIFVTVDSDSIIETDTLRNMASPFVVNEKCGAVAGNVRVLNNSSAIIPKMLNVSFVFSFELIRSAQSALGSVLCTPGALSAYRKTAVMPVLENWINQTFLGQPSDIGEDRAMTNMILKQGYHVLFQRNAFVLTNVPERYKNLYKMFIRWERSNVRENIMMSKFAFTKFRHESCFGPRILLLQQWFKVIMSYPLTLMMLVFVLSFPIYFLCSTLVGILIFSSIQVFFYTKRHNFLESLWAYPYAMLYAFGLFWITPYAIATAGKRGWLTRG